MAPTLRAAMPVPVIFKRPRRLRSLPWFIKSVLLVWCLSFMLSFLSASLSIGMKQIFPRAAHHD
ncbi:hypothetical protein D3C87_1779540 [compost metagenome]